MNITSRIGLIIFLYSHLVWPAISGMTQSWELMAQADLSFIRQTLIDNHPGYHNDEDPEFRNILQKNYDELLKAAYEIATQNEYVATIQAYIKKFDDIHVSIEMFRSGHKKMMPDKYDVPDFAVHELAPDIVWVTLPTFNPNKMQQEQLEKIIHALSGCQTKTAIIFDVRGNGGGNSLWAHKILSSLFSERYATQKINEQESKTIVDWRCSPDNIEHIQTFMPLFKAQFTEDSEAYQWAKKVYHSLSHAQQDGKLYFSEKLETKYTNASELANPVKARIVVIIDRSCASSCLSFIDYLKSMHEMVILIGQTTNADSVYTEVRQVALPSGQGLLCFPIKVYRNRVRGHKEPYKPDIVIPS